MRRLFWVAVGAAGTVALAGRLRTAWRRYTPQGVAEQVEAAGHGAVEDLHAAVDTFRSARAERERALTASLLVTPEGGDPHAVLRRDRSAARHPATSAGSAPVAGAGARPAGRVDDDEPLYDF